MKTNSIDSLTRTLEQVIKEVTLYENYNKAGVLLYELGDVVNAEKYLNKAYLLCPHNKDVLYNYGLVLSSNDKLREAAKIYTEYLELNPGEKEIIEKLQELYYRLGDYTLFLKVGEEQSER